MCRFPPAYKTDMSIFAEDSHYACLDNCKCQLDPRCVLLSVYATHTKSHGVQMGLSFVLKVSTFIIVCKSTLQHIAHCLLIVCVWLCNLNVPARCERQFVTARRWYLHRQHVVTFASCCGC